MSAARSDGSSKAGTGAHIGRDKLEKVIDQLGLLGK
jgi:hypothetical protein